MSQPATSTLEHTETIVDVRTDDGDHDRFAHYVNKKDLEAALFSGVPATALCGKKWLPTKDASQFPVCPTCKDIYWNVVQPGDPDHPDFEG